MPIALTAKIAPDVRILNPELVNLYGCVVGPQTGIGAFVEIQVGVVVGARCKISSHSFLCEGVTIEDEVFIGHGVMFTNDRFPAATNEDGSPKGGADWTLQRTLVKRRASIGSGAVLVPGIVIGEGALIGTGAVVTKSVPDFAVVAGNPAVIVGDTRSRGSP